MRVAVFSTRGYDRQFLDEANEGWHELAYHEIRLTSATAAVAAGYAAVCAFVNDQLSEETLSLLQAGDMQILYHPGPCWC
jgi:D-lactate dehydrogenase